MSSWSDGYVADVGYTYGYYPELNPLRVRLSLMYAGIVPPNFGHACELGFGQGVTLVAHAATSGVHWHGTDFNPAQAAWARDLADAAGATAGLAEEAFVDYRARNDLPDFDFIGLQGIWSWVSPLNRELIVDFVKRKLRPGGVVYLGYNTLPGWSGGATLRRLMAEHQSRLSAPGLGSLEKVEAATGFVDQVLKASPAFLAQHPDLLRRFEAVKALDRQYVAHEYFNQNWDPMYFSDTARLLEPAKLNYACQARPLDLIDPINLTAEQHATLTKVPDPVLRETVRDFMLNRQFRRDYWVKGLRRLAPVEQSELIRRQRVVLVSPRSAISLTVNGHQGEARLNDAIYQPLIEQLADHRPQFLGDLERRLAPRGITFAQLMQAAMVLCGQHHLEPAQDDEAVAQACEGAHRLNEALMDKARASTDVAYLTSPVTGGALPATRSTQLFAHALQQGLQEPEACARHALAHLAGAEGAGRPVDPEALATLAKQAKEFLAHQRPILEGLQMLRLRSQGA